MILNIVTTPNWIPSQIDAPYLHRGLCLISTFYTRRIICYLRFGQIACNLPAYLFMKDPTGQTQSVYLRDVKYNEEVFQDLLTQPKAQASRLRLIIESSKYENNKQLYNVIKEDFYTRVRKDCTPYHIYDYIRAFFLYSPLDEEGVNFILDLCESNQELRRSLNNIAKYDIYVFKKSLPKMSYQLLDRLSNLLYRALPIQLQIAKYKVYRQSKPIYRRKINNDV